MNARALPLYATILIFVVAYALAYSQFPNILSTRVIGNLLTDNAYLGIVAVGMTLVILSGGIDLSVGAVIAFSGVFIAVMLRDTGLHPLAVEDAFDRERSDVRNEPRTLDVDKSRTAFGEPLIDTALAQARATVTRSFSTTTTPARAPDRGNRGR